MAEIVRRYGKAYRARFGNRLLPSHNKALKDIQHCRTKALGGQVYECPEHHELAYRYHSCMNRSCPKCQNSQAQAWLEKEQKRLINVPYFFVTFTLPEQLRSIARSNQNLFTDVRSCLASHERISLRSKISRWFDWRIGCTAYLEPNTDLSSAYSFFGACWSCCWKPSDLAAN